MRAEEILLRQMPAADHGRPVGVADWRIVVEAIMPTAEASRWGVFRWGEDPWSAQEWQDLTPWVKGQSWERGSQETHGRPREGNWTITLRNNDRRWSPWADIAETDAAYRAPGTLIRVGVHVPGVAWVPQFAGVVESWGDRDDAVGALSEITVTVIETPSALARIDDNALGFVVGGGEPAAARFTRLLEDAGWRYGLAVEFDPDWELQSTDMADNRAGEMHLTADSVDARWTSHRSGLGWVVAADAREHPVYPPPDVARWGTFQWGVGRWSRVPADMWPTARISSIFHSGIELRPHLNVDPPEPDADGRVPLRLVYDADSIATANDTDVVINDVRLARADGTQQVADDLPSIQRYGKISYARSDLINNNDADVAELAARIRDRRSQNVRRVEAVTISGLKPPNMPGLMYLDVGDWLSVHMPDDATIVPGAIAGLIHQVTPLTDGSLRWTTNVAIDTYPAAA